MTLLNTIAKRRTFRTTKHPVRCSTALAKGELKVIQLIQALAYPDIALAIEDKFQKRKFAHYRSIRALHPFIDEDSVVRVGGRLERSTFSYA